MGRGWSTNPLAINLKVVGHSVLYGSLYLLWNVAFESVQLLLLAVTPVVRLPFNFGVTLLTHVIPASCSFHKLLRIPNTLLIHRLPVCLMGFRGPPRIQLVPWADSSTYIGHAVFPSTVQNLSFGTQDVFGVDVCYCQR